MKVSELKNSRFLTKEDCGDGIVVTIDDVTQENVASPDQPAEMRWTMMFQEPNTKPMVLNSTNGQLIAKFLGSDDSDDWKAKKVVLYHDENVSFAGKIVGGIRARKYDEPAAALANEDDIPW